VSGQICPDAESVNTPVKDGLRILARIIARDLIAKRPRKIDKGVPGDNEDEIE
jgi:hypothetical protein